MKRIKQEPDGEKETTGPPKAVKRARGVIGGIFHHDDDPAIVQQVMSLSRGEGQLEDESLQMLSTLERPNASNSHNEPKDKPSRSYYRDQVVQLSTQNEELKEDIKRLKQQTQISNQHQAGHSRTQTLIAQQEWNKKLVEAMETDLTCSICSEVLIQPVTGKCGHLFCSSCINSWFQADQSRRACPTCRKRWGQNQKVELKPVEGHINQLYSLLSPKTRQNRADLLEERRARAAETQERLEAAASQERRQSVELLEQRRQREELLEQRRRLTAQVAQLRAQLPYNHGIPRVCADRVRQRPQLPVENPAEVEIMEIPNGPIEPPSNTAQDPADRTHRSERFGAPSRGQGSSQRNRRRDRSGST